MVYSNYLYHHGVKGMKWGIRHDPQSSGNGLNNNARMSREERKRAERNKKIKRAAIIGGAAVAAGLAIYGGYKYKQHVDNKTLNAGRNAISTVFPKNGSSPRDNNKFGMFTKVEDIHIHPENDPNESNPILDMHLRSVKTNYSIKSNPLTENPERRRLTELSKAQNSYLARNASLGGKNIGTARGAIGKPPIVGKDITETQKKKSWIAYQSAKNTESQLKAARRNGVTGLDDKIKKAEKAVNQRHNDVDKVFFNSGNKAPASFLKSYNPTPKRASSSGSGLDDWRKAQEANKKLLDKQLTDTISGIPTKRRRRR